MLDILSGMGTKRKSLGEFLQTARDRTGLSLRAVERATEVSNAYLSQIESDKIQQPSPIILHKLSALYEVSYADVLRLAGYPLPETTESGEGSAEFMSRIGPLSEEEEDALVEYLEFMRSRRKRGT